MAKKKKQEEIYEVSEPIDIGITTVLESNYMPYTMSVIVARAIPEIDGFKPSHRKLLYTMFKMGLLNGGKQKSAKVVGQTMVLNPHGDASIYDTLVRLTTGRESLPHPFIESKGTFGKQYSSMSPAASRYTECKLAKICEEIFGGIDRDAVDFVPNYDNTTTEPTVLPVSFPNVLVSPNNGIAVGMASTICSFNLVEICNAAKAFIDKPDMTSDELLDILTAPDFSTGGIIIYNRDKMREIYETGQGSFKVRAKYVYNKAENRIEVVELPYTTTLEKVKEQIVKLVKDGKIKDISDIRDEIDITGLRMSIDLKRGADPEKLMARLFKQTELQDSFPCNFNILVGGVPRTMGVLEILDEWTAFRVECLRRMYIFDLGKKSDKLHLLYGLREILLDIDKAIRIVRGTENDRDVVPNLMEGFHIDEVQAEYVADIKLRNLNKDYILKRIEEIGELENDIENLKSLVSSDLKIKKVIKKQLDDIAVKYGRERKTSLMYEDEVEEILPTETVDDYSCVVFLSKEGYFKKCTPTSLRAYSEQKYKENDSLMFTQETSNAFELLFFTSFGQVYKSRLSDFDDIKASALGDYIPAKLSFDADERVVGIIVLREYSGQFILFFENGKAVRLPLSCYETKTNRKKLTGAFFSKSPVVGVYVCKTAPEYLLLSDDGRALLVGETQVVEKTTRSSSGATVFKLRKNKKLVSAIPYTGVPNKLIKESKYRKSILPASGTVFEDFDMELNQQTLL